jgi:hypothetical protein
MTLEEMLVEVERAGLKCADSTVRKLIKERILPEPLERKRGQGQKSDYSRETLLRLLIVLQLEQSPPRGLGISSLDKKRAFLGAVGDEQTVDAYLPAVAYVMEVPRIDVEEARKSGIRFLRRHLKEARETFYHLDLPNGKRSLPLSALGNMVLGGAAFREPETYGAPELTGDFPLTIRDGMANALPEWLRPLLESKDLADAARISHPALHYRALKNAPAELLREAALFARVLTWAAGPGPAPRAETLLAHWGFLIACLRYVPWARWLIGVARTRLLGFQSPEDALRLVERGDVGKAMRRGDLGAVGVIVTNELEFSD